MVLIAWVFIQKQYSASSALVHFHILSSRMKLIVLNATLSDMLVTLPVQVVQSSLAFTYTPTVKICYCCSFSASSIIFEGIQFDVDWFIHRLIYSLHHICGPLISIDWVLPPVEILESALSLFQQWWLIANTAFLLRLLHVFSICLWNWNHSPYTCQSCVHDTLHMLCS